MSTDLDLNSSADVYTTGGKDLATNSGLRNVLQSIGIHVRSVVVTLVGETITPAFLNEIEEDIRSAISSDENISTIRTFNIGEVNKQTNTITIDIETELNDFGQQQIELSDITSADGDDDFEYGEGDYGDGDFGE